MGLHNCKPITVSHFDAITVNGGKQTSPFMIHNEREGFNIARGCFLMCVFTLSTSLPVSL